MSINPGKSCDNIWIRDPWTRINLGPDQKLENFGSRGPQIPDFHFDQLIFRAFFSYFDENQCRWETEQDNCDDYVTDVTDSDVTFSGDSDSEVDSVVDSGALDDIDTDTDANVTDNVADSMDTNDGSLDVTESTDIDDDEPVVTESTDTTDREPEVTESTDTKEPDVTTTQNDITSSFQQNLECEPLDETWLCSSGSTNHSLCIKFCTVGQDFYMTLLRTTFSSLTCIWKVWLENRQVGQMGSFKLERFFCKYRLKAHLQLERY